MAPIFKDIKSSFWLFGTLFSINRAAATVQLTFAVPLVGDKSGSVLSIIFLYTCMVGCLFLGPMATALLRARQTMMLGSICFAASVWMFVAATAGLDDVAKSEIEDEMKGARHALAVLAGLLGGLGAGFVWPPWSVYLTLTVDDLCRDGTPREQISAKLTSEFAVVYLLADFFFSFIAGRLMQVGMSNAWVFTVLAIVTSVTALVFPLTHDLAATSNSSKRFAQVTRAVQLWPDARLWLFLVTTVAFGFSASFMMAVVSNETKESQLGKSGLGYLDAFSVAVAGLTACGCGVLAKKVSHGLLIGISLGAACFLMVAVFDLSVFFDSKELRDTGYLLILLFLFQGIGRGVYESVNKAVFVDHFPQNQDGAGGNQILLCTVAMGAFFLGPGVAGVEVPSYVRSGLVGTLALCVVPCYLLGTDITRRRNAAHKSDGGSDDDAAGAEDTDPTKSGDDAIEKGTAHEELSADTTQS